MTRLKPRPKPTEIRLAGSGIRLQDAKAKPMKKQKRMR